MDFGRSQAGKIGGKIGLIRSQTEDISPNVQK